jgi:hypothetical protein
MEKCRIQHRGQTAPTKPTFHHNSRVMYLNPNSTLEGQRSRALTFGDFSLLTQISKAASYQFDATTLFTRDTIRVIANALRTAAERKCEPLDVETNRQLTEKYLAFLKKDGVAGFFISRR